MFSLLGTLIIGLIVGAIAKLIVRGKEPGGCLITMAIGVAGSFVAFYIGRALGNRGASGQFASGRLYTIPDRCDRTATDLSHDPPPKEVKASRR